MQVSLQVIKGRPAGKNIHFPNGSFLFGRGTECDIRPNSALVSQQHCQLRIGPKGAFLRDLGSRNGTLLNGRRVVGECGLLQGDHIQVGPLVFAVSLTTITPATRGTELELAALADTRKHGQLVSGGLDRSLVGQPS
jgi:pSer/pThr/pTyr-binding forkhead associated (FHA) protein